MNGPRRDWDKERREQKKRRITEPEDVFRPSETEIYNAKQKAISAKRKKAQLAKQSDPHREARLAKWKNSAEYKKLRAKEKKRADQRRKIVVHTEVQSGASDLALSAVRDADRKETRRNKTLRAIESATRRATGKKHK